MKISFIGAGKVGTAFGKYLFENGFVINGYLSKSFASAKKAAELTKSQAYTDTAKLIIDTDILFITTPDDVIEEICKNLCKNNLLKQGLIICHMSGALSSEALSTAAFKGCFIYSLHPLQAFADINTSIQDLPETVFSIEGSAEKINEIKNIMNKTGNKYFIINSKDKTLYHITACVVSNYLVSLLNFGTSFMKNSGLEKRDIINAMSPLIEGTVKNVLNLGPEKGLTGPISRGDIKTIEKHLMAINNYCPENLELYKLLGEITLDLAVKEKLKDVDKEKKLKKLLGGYAND